MIFRSPFPDAALPEITLHDLILNKASLFPTNTALVDGPSGRSYTYAQLSGAIRLVASNLIKRGLLKGETVAIYSPNIPEYAFAFFGTAMAGGIVTTVNPLYTVNELAHQLKDAKAKFLITIPMFLPNALEAAKQAGIQEVVVFGEGEGATPFSALMAGDGQMPVIPFNPKEDVVVLPYSSGTTGLPKGVMLTHHNLTANIRQVISLEQLTPGDSMIAVLPFFHIYGMTCIMAGMLYENAKIVTMPRFDLQLFLELVQQHKITRAYIVPPIMLALAKHPMIDNYDLSSIQYLTSGAAPMSEAVAKACADRIGCIVKQGYGMTEASPVTNMNSPSAPIKLASVGPIAPNTELKIISTETKKELGVTEIGELLFRGPQVMKGYLNNPKATEEALDEEGWLHTGDIGYIDAEGYVYVVDRFKEFIKYRGYQVAPAELESILLGHVAVGDAAVIPAPDEESGEVPKAFVVKKSEVTAEELMDYVAAQVAPYKKLRMLEFIDEIPKSASGKILRRVLIERERQKIS